MMPTDIGDQIVVNDKKSPIYKEDGKTSIKIAPGEGKVPSNILREDHFDVKAFPKHHPDGQYGLHHQPRKSKLSPQVYFNQRLLNADERFSKDPCYLFMASYYVERLSLERQINISGLRTRPNQTGGEEKPVKLNDVIAVLQKVKGSPKYWQTAQYELVAKVKQLGPFHIFITFSCGEMRWAECFLNILKRSGWTIKIPEDWDGNEDDLVVEENGKNYPLWKFVNDVMSQTKHQLFKDYTFIITRLFDNRVKSFVTNILMGGGRKIRFQYYSYRVEFQARGMYSVVIQFFLLSDFPQISFTLAQF